MDNYNQIILTLDKGIRNNEYDKWPIGELPTFSFANDVDPWSLCQDVPYDKPNPWGLVEVEIIDLNNKKGELYWKWGKPELNGPADWKAFTYKFDVEKENGKWRIFLFARVLTLKRARERTEYKKRSSIFGFFKV